MSSSRIGMRVTRRESFPPVATEAFEIWFPRGYRALGDQPASEMYPVCYGTRLPQASGLALIFLEHRSNLAQLHRLIAEYRWVAA